MLKRVCTLKLFSKKLNIDKYYIFPENLLILCVIHNIYIYACFTCIPEEKRFPFTLQQFLRRTEFRSTLHECFIEPMPIYVHSTNKKSTIDSKATLPVIFQ